MKSILFIDDEANILSGLRRMLNVKKSIWKMVFVQSGEEALKVLEKDNFDVVVSDMRMPCMNGVRLLTTVRIKYPRISRIALSGYSDTEMILESIKATHLFIAKPTDFETLNSAIERCLSIQTIIHDNELCDYISGISSLPSMPEIYERLLSELTSPDASIDQVGKLIEQDIGMSVKLLQIVNSAFFGLAREIISPAQAAAHLGLDIVKSLVLSIKVFESFEEGIEAGGLDKIFHRAQSVAHLAREIGKFEGFDQKQREQLLIAGLLQDIGELVIIKYFPKILQEEFKTSELQSTESIVERERRIYGVSHEQIGVYLLHLWGIPLTVVECIAHHHDVLNTIDPKQLSQIEVLFIANLIVSADERQDEINQLNTNKEFNVRYQAWQGLAI